MKVAMPTYTASEHSFRRMFNLITSDMENWKDPIVYDVQMDDNKNWCRTVNRITASIAFMVGGKADFHVWTDRNGKRWITLSNPGYYRNIGA